MINHGYVSATLKYISSISCWMASSFFSFSYRRQFNTHNTAKQQLQRVQNNAARIVLQAPRRSHTTPLLNTLHWLPVQQRIDYKVALLTFKVHSTSTPSYLHRLLQDREDVHNLRWRSATPALTTMAKRAFRCTTPAIWNSLPKTVLDSDTVTSFKSRQQLPILTYSLRLSLILLLITIRLPGPSTSEVTTLWRYTNIFIIIITRGLSGAPAP